MRKEVSGVRDGTHDISSTASDSRLQDKVDGVNEVLPLSES